MYITSSSSLLTFYGLYTYTQCSHTHTRIYTHRYTRTKSHFNWWKFVLTILLISIRRRFSYSSFGAYASAGGMNLITKHKVLPKWNNNHNKFFDKNAWLVTTGRSHTTTMATQTTTATTFVGTENLSNSRIVFIGIENWIMCSRIIWGIPKLSSQST